MKIPSAIKIFSILIFTSFLGCAQKQNKNLTIFQTTKFSKEDILNDLEQYVDFIRQTHPRITYTVNPQSLDTALMGIRKKITDSMPANKVWDLFASLNPIFNDAHIGIIGPENMYQEYRSSGGANFPYSVKIKQGELYIDWISTPNRGSIENYKILSINGVESLEILSTLLPKMRGESQSLQELILSRRFPIFYTMHYGEFKRHELELMDEQQQQVRVVIDSNDTGEAGTQDQKKEEYYHFEKINDSVVYLKIASFEIENKSTFALFLDDSFAKIHSSNISHLILDIGENGGGARDLSDLLLDYLTTERYTATSKVEARITEQNKSMIPDATVGDVVTVPFPKWVQPKNEVPVFKGNVYVLVSEQSYSQAIVFATIVQDFDLGKIVGEETAGKANQTGQVQKLSLGHTGFTVYCPIYIFHRAKVFDGTRGVIPDIEVPYSEAKETALSLTGN